MKYLVKDLSQLSGFSPARIRKWQERYHILNPEKGENGYYYFSNEDLKTLLFIKEKINQNYKIKEILNELNKPSITKEKIFLKEFTKEELELIFYISHSNFNAIQNYLDKIYRKNKFNYWIQSIRKLLLLTGKAWEKNLLSIADEHTFSRWIYLYISKKIIQLQTNKDPTWLVCVFPGDEHELGALLHYAKLLYFKVPAKFVGMLPEKELLKEIKQNYYKVISISLVMPQKKEKIDTLKKKIQKQRPNIKVLFGGIGYRKLKENNKNQFFKEKKS